MSLAVKDYSVPSVGRITNNSKKRNKFADTLSGEISSARKKSHHKNDDSYRKQFDGLEKMCELRQQAYDNRKNLYGLSEITEEKITDMDKVQDSLEECASKVNYLEPCAIRYTSYYTGGHYIDSETGVEVINGSIDRVFYTKDGIYSVTVGNNSKYGKTDKFNWMIEFNSETDYERVMNFLDRVPIEDESIFTTREYFWKDFLDGKIDEDEFLQFYDTLEHGAALLLKFDENGKSYIDHEMMKSKYVWYFEIQKVESPTEEELIEMLFHDAHKKDIKNTSVNLEDTLRNTHAKNSSDYKCTFWNDDVVYSLDDWIRKIIDQTRNEMMESLLNNREGKYQRYCREHGIKKTD